MFNKRTKIKELLTWQPQGQEVTVMGWVRTFRNNQFVALNDGSTNNNLQVVLELGKFDDEFLKSGDRSMKDVVRERYGDKAVELIEGLLGKIENKEDTVVNYPEVKIDKF